MTTDVFVNSQLEAFADGSAGSPLYGVSLASPVTVSDGDQDILSLDVSTVVTGAYFVGTAFGTASSVIDCIWTWGNDTLNFPPATSEWSLTAFANYLGSGNWNTSIQVQFTPFSEGMASSDSVSAMVSVAPSAISNFTFPAGFTSPLTLGVTEVEVSGGPNSLIVSGASIVQLL